MTAPENAELLGVEVPVAKIERKLRELWEVDDARANASLINLALYSEENGDLARNSEIVREITREHACRALLIGRDVSVEKVSVRSWITAHCHLVHGKKSVCCEQIAFHLTGTSRGRFRNTIFAHLQSDLPLVFWWQGNLSGMFNESLYRRIDRFVIDSSDWGDVVAQYGRVNAAIEEVGLVVQDLAWTRTYHFRLAVASLYDDLVAARSLVGTRSVKVVVSEQYRTSGLLLLAWFAEMAGWERAQDLIEDDGHGGSYRFETREGGLVDASVVFEEGGAPIGMIEVESVGVCLRVSREVGGKHLHHQFISEGHVVDLHGPVDSDFRAELLADQLSRGGKNSLFKRTLPTFLSLLHWEGS